MSDHNQPDDGSGSVLPAIVSLTALFAVGFLGFVWMVAPCGGYLPLPLGWPGFAFGWGLLLLGGLGLVLFKDRAAAIWRGSALAAGTAGGYALLLSIPAAIDCGLPWPGVPDWLLALIAIVYAIGILLALGSRPPRSLAMWPAAIGAALAFLLSMMWVFVGALGIWPEVFTALLEAAALGLMVLLLFRSLLHFAPDAMSNRPIQIALLFSYLLVCLHPSLLAPRGYSFQNIMLLIALAPAGLLAGSLLILRPSHTNKGLLWQALPFFFLAYLFPLAFTEGFEAEWMPVEATTSWPLAALYSFFAGLFLAALVLIFRGFLSRVTRRRFLVLVPAGLTLVILGAAYLTLGAPGVQPDTFLVILKDQADTSFANATEDRASRVKAVFNTLTDHAEASQSDLRSELDARGIHYQPYYLVNAMEVSGGALIQRNLRRRDDVSRILNSPHTRMQPPLALWLQEQLANSLLGVLSDPLYAPGTLAEGVERIQAQRVWDELDIRGEGILVGIADSGVSWRHPALIDSYAGSAANHDYAWFDPWAGSREPIDTASHGTHTTGTTVGADGIGVAPGARWIGCRNLARNLGNPAYYLACMQFLFAPFPLDGDPFQDGDPLRGAHLTNNSWGCPPQEGCDGNTLGIAIDHLRNAGQMMVISAGNDGPNCGTIGAPANAGGAFSVGAVDVSGTIAVFSSRGPTVDRGEVFIKPDIVAPGLVSADAFVGSVIGIPSSVPGDGYARFPGTSMAGPHVAGTVALLWSANSDLIGDIDATEEILRATAENVSIEFRCGEQNIEGENVYGAGLVNAYEAVLRAMETAETP